MSLDTNYTVDTSCYNSDVRLVGGINELECRVEICYNKIWGSVRHSCSTYDANVVCKQLGHQPTGRYCYKVIVSQIFVQLHYSIVMFVYARYLMFSLMLNVPPMGIIALSYNVLIMH